MRAIRTRCGQNPLIHSMAVPRPASIAADNSKSDSVVAPKDPRHPNNVCCLVEDHLHHNDNGGWMMADVWYEGLQSYLR